MPRFSLSHVVPSGCFWRTQQEGEILARDTLTAHAVVSRRRKRRFTFQLHMRIFPSSFIEVCSLEKSRVRLFPPPVKQRIQSINQGTAAAASELPLPHFETRGLNKLALRKRQPMRMCGVAWRGYECGGGHSLSTSTAAAAAALSLPRGESSAIELPREGK